MSSKKSENLIQLFLIANRGYAEPGTIASYGWDFEKDQYQPPGIGDDMARFICAEMSDVFDETQTPAEQMLTAASYIEKSAKELTDLAAYMETFAIRQVAFQFFVWFKESKRSTITEGLIQSWLDIHPIPEIRDLGPFVKDEILALAAVDTRLTPEILDGVLQKAEAQVSLKADLEEILKQTEPEPVAVPDPTLLGPQSPRSSE